MNKIIQILSKLFRKKERSVSGKHYRNIRKGKQIEIDGKKYVKVKLKFVDSMDYNSGKHLDNLEWENELLNREVSRLKRKFELCRTKSEQLQICNIYIFRENRIRKRIISEKNDIIRDQNDEINSLGSIVKKQEALLKKDQWIIEYNKEIRELIAEFEKTHTKLETLYKKNKKIH